MLQLTRFRKRTIAGVAGLALAFPATLIPASPAAATGDSITSFTAGVGPSLTLGWTGAADSYIGIAKAASFTASDPCNSADWYAAAEVPENKVGYFYFDGSTNPREFYSYYDWNNTGWFPVEPLTQYVACLIDGSTDEGRGSPFTVTTGTGVAPYFTNKTTVNGLGNNATRGVFALGSNIYAATNGGGLSISADGGTTWTNKTTTNGLGSNTVRGVYSQLGTIYAATNGGLSISTDSGASWANKTTTAGLATNSLYGVYASGSNIYVATQSGLAISTDGGESFVNRNLGGSGANGVYAIGDNVYAATGGGLYISTDGGVNYTTKTTTDGLSNNTVNGVYVAGSTIYAATAGGLSISTNGGTTWTNKTSADGLGNTYVLGVYANGSNIYAATPSGLSLSIDGGANWATKTTTDGLGNNTVYGVYASGSTIYAATDGGLSIHASAAPTISGVSPSTGPTAGNTPITITGTNFSPGGSSGVTVGGVAATSVTVVTPTSIVATTPAGTAGAANVVVTNSDGQTATSTGGFTYLAPAPTIAGVSPSQGSTAGGRLITITGTGFTSGGAFGVAVDGSACASSSWVSASAVTCTTPAHSAGTVNVVVTNSDGQTATSTGGFTYVAPSSSLFTNYTAADGLGNTIVSGVYATGDTIYAATYGGLSISSDGGNNWVTKTGDNGLGGNLLRGVYAIDGAPDTVYAATADNNIPGLPGGLSISTNGGDTFTNYTTTEGLGSNNLRGVFAIGSAVYAATTGVGNPPTGGGLTISTNGGTSFTNYTTAEGLGSNTVYGVYASGSTIYAATAPAGNPPTGGGLAISTNGGTTWTNKTVANTSNGLGSNTVYGVYASGSTVYAATAGGLSISTDGGDTWTNKTVANTSGGLGNNGVRGVYARGSTVYAATESGLSISTDGGGTFTKYTASDGLGSSFVYGVYASGDTIYAATSGGLSIGAATAAPTITAVSPSTGSAAGGTAITISGTNFTSGGSFGVTVGGVAATAATVVSSTSITATTPPGTTGAANVVVTNSDGQTATSTGGFTYTAVPDGGGDSGGNSGGGTPIPTPTPTASVIAPANPSAAPNAPITVNASPGVKGPVGVEVLTGSAGAKARRVVVREPLSLNPMTASSVRVPSGSAVALVVRGLPASSPLTVAMSASPQTRARSSYVPIGQVRSSANGWATVPAFKPSRAGTHTIKLAAANGKAFYLKVTVTAKAKPVKQPTAKPAVAGKARA